METEKSLKILQLFYAGVLVDALSVYETFGITEQVTIRKQEQQHRTAKTQLQQLIVGTPEELFEKISQVFGCDNWKVESTAMGLEATGKGCLLCMIAKNLWTVQPCDIYCIQPLKALNAALDPGWKLSVTETLWEGKQCQFFLEPRGN